MVGSQQIVRFHYQIVGSVARYGVATERKRARAIGSVANGSFEFVGERYGLEHRFKVVVAVGTFAHHVQT